jgi:hypothetical protein
MAKNAMGAEFTGLPIRDLIGTPLLEAARVDHTLAMDFLDYIQKLAFEGNDPKKLKTRVLDVSFDRAFENNGQVTSVPAHMVMPLIGMVDTSKLSIEKATVDFTMSVAQQESSARSVDTGVSASGSFGYGPWSASISGHVDTHSEHTRSSDKSAKYTIHVEAGRQPVAEGLAKFVQAMVDQQKVQSIGGK